MIKTLACLVRRPDLSREAFREHYEDTHVPLALGVFCDWQRYARNHVVDQVAGAAGSLLIESPALDLQVRRPPAPHVTAAAFGVLRDQIELQGVCEPRRT